MGCGNEISSWDDKAIKDSLNGKNSELDPKLKAEALEYREARLELHEKTKGFEILKDEKGEQIVDSKIISSDIASIPLAREMLKPSINMNILEVRYSDQEDGYRGRSFSTWDVESYKGNIIEIHRSTDHSNIADIEHTIFHEIGETYFRQVLTDSNMEGAAENFAIWEEFLAETSMRNLENPDLYPLNTVEKQGDVKGVEEHFSECFARYAMHALEDTKQGDDEAIKVLKEMYPEQCEFFEKLLREIKRK